MTPEQINYVNERWHQLNGLLLDSIRVAVNYLFIVNGGGCVAVLAFLGNEKADNNKTLLLTVLALFFIGLVLVGILNVVRYRYFNKLVTNWIEHSNKFIDGKITYEELTEKDDALVDEGDNTFLP